MERNISRRRALGLAGTGSAVVAVGMMGGEAGADEANAFGGAAAMGAVGVTRTEVARLSAVNYDDAAAGGIAGGGCLVALEIHLLTGQLLASGRFQLAPGQGAFLDASNIVGQTSREQIYGVVKHVIHGASRPHVHHTMGATLEVFDAQTGVTVALLLPAVQRIREAA